MSIQILGQDGSTVQKVDPLFNAARVSLRPPDITGGGWYSFTMVSGALTGVAANGAVWSLRYAPGTGNVLMVRRVAITWGTTTAFTTAQSIAHELYFARSFTASDSGQTGGTLTGNNGKHRTSLATTGITDLRISTTAAVSAGTRTLDNQPLGVSVGTSNGIGTSMPLTTIFSHDASDHPIILANNEGLVIQNAIAMGAAGVIKLYVTVECAELTAY